MTEAADFRVTYMGTAIVCSDGHFRDGHGKTAHGLVRGTKRFRVLGVIDDQEKEGSDAGAALDGLHRGIPFFSSAAVALDMLSERPQFVVVGVASHGGRLPPALRSELLFALDRGLSIVNGLHDFVGDDPTFVRLAAERNAQIIDVRRPKPRKELHFWSGDVVNLRAPRIAVMGTDCNIGKRTTARMLVEQCRQDGVRAELIYTGQTGWMQGEPFGFIFDSIYNDFVSGELEHAVLSCAVAADPDVIFLEGQSALRNPCGPCGAEFLLSAQAKGVILHHAPGRPFVRGYEQQMLRIPSVESEIDLVAAYGSKVIGISLSEENIAPEALRDEQARLRRTTGLPVVCPLGDGVEELARAVRVFLAEQGVARRGL